MEIKSHKRKRTKFQQYNEEGNLICYCCKQYKPESDFDNTTPPSNWFRNHKDRRCKECKRKQYLKRREASRGKRDLDRMILERWHAARDRAKTHNIDFNLTVEYLKQLWDKQEGKCALSGIGMTYIFNCGRVHTNLSIDRITPSLGYIEGNVQLVCMACNQIKSDLTEEKMYNFCKMIVNNYEDVHKCK